MRKFLIRTTGMILGAVFMFLLINIAYYKFANKVRLSAFEVYEAVDIAGVNGGYTGLILGDSVARQIFSPQYQDESGDICYLATNQAIMTVGNFMLLERFIEHNPQLEDVYYIAKPDSMMGNVNFIYTYSYFVTPLYKEPFIQCLEPGTREEIETIFGRFCARREFPKWMFAKYPKLLDIYQNGCDTILQLRRWAGRIDEEDMAALYLGKMKEVCDENNIRFYLLSPPVPESYQYSFEEMEQKLTFEGKEEILDEFRNSIIYVEEEELVDGVHMSGSFLEQNRERIKESLLPEDTRKDNT